MTRKKGKWRYRSDAAVSVQGVELLSSAHPTPSHVVRYVLHGYTHADTLSLCKIPYTTSHTLHKST